MNEGLFQALACMGEATEKMSWANTWVEDLDIPDDLKAEMKRITAEIDAVSEKVRVRRG